MKGDLDWQESLHQVSVAKSVKSSKNLDNKFQLTVSKGPKYMER